MTTDIFNDHYQDNHPYPGLDQKNLQQVPNLFKIVLLGDRSVGKTSLVNRYLFNEFFPDTKKTIGVNIHSHTLKLINNGRQMRIGLSLLDIGGQEGIERLIPYLLAKIHAMILVFDLTSIDSLLGLKHWLDILKSLQGHNDFPKILVGTKLDIIEINPDLIIDAQLIQDFMIRNQIQDYIPTSSKSGINIPIIIDQIVDLIVMKKNELSPK